MALSSQPGVLAGTDNVCSGTVLSADEVLERAVNRKENTLHSLGACIDTVQAPFALLQQGARLDIMERLDERPRTTAGQKVRSENAEGVAGTW
jgi:hypothetical protein